jgi:hypothetical protein
MKNRSFAFFTAAVLLLNMAGLAAGDTRGARKKSRQSNALVALLPASDAVATLDSSKFFSDAMPKILASNQPMLASIMAQLDEMQAKTGIDLRKFDSVAIGFTITRVNAKDYDFDPVAIARGDLRAGALVAIAKLASNGTYRAEKLGEQTIYVFSAKDVVQKTSAKNNNSKIVSMMESSLNGLTREIAVTALDDNTIAFGSLKRVRETIEAKTHVSPEVSGLLAEKETSVIVFAMRTPDGMSKLLPLDNDELGANIDSIRFISGSLDVATAGLSMQMIAKTVKPEQAKGLYETLDGLKMIGKAFLGNSKRADQKIYARMIENAAIGLHGNQVTFDLLVPQADIDTMLSTVK